MRLVHVGTFVALGLPIVCLLALYGGLNPENVFFVYLGTFTVSLFLAGLSILVSVLARWPRDAVLVTYTLVAVWLMGPPVMSPIAHSLGWAFGWFGPVNDWMLMTSPMVVWSQMTSAYRVVHAGMAASVLGFRRIPAAVFLMVGSRGGQPHLHRARGGRSETVARCLVAGSPARDRLVGAAGAGAGRISHGRVAAAGPQPDPGAPPNRPLLRQGPDVLERAIYHDGRRPPMAGQPDMWSCSSACCWAATSST